MATRSPSPGPSSTTQVISTRHATSATDKQRAQLAKLLKDPAKPVHIPAPPKEKSLRPAREMMKNVQGSSAGAGSGEFHVYKASRRREYERLHMLDEANAKEQRDAEFERKRKEVEDAVEAKTAKNRAKRQKKKQAKIKGSADGQKDSESGSGDKKGGGADTSMQHPLKKRRVVNGKELVFRIPGEGSDDEEDGGPVPGEGFEEDGAGPIPDYAVPEPVKIIDAPRVVIHDD